MTERTQMIREKLNAPEALVEAVAKGEPYRHSNRSGERKSRHVKRITAAIAVYVCAALLIVGVAMLLPDILDQQPAHTQPVTERTTNGTSDRNADTTPQKFEYVITPYTEAFRLFINTDVDDNEDYPLRYNTEKRRLSGWGVFSEDEYKLEDAEPIVQFEFKGKTYEYKLYQSVENVNKLGNNETLKSLCWMDHYYSYADEENKVRSGSLLIQHETGQVIVFNDYDAWGNITEGDLTEQGAVELAEEDLISFVGEEEAAQYTFDSVEVYSNPDVREIHVEYTRYICGYPTFDTIEFIYNFSGEICEISAFGYRIFDAAESEITLEKITKAEKVFTDALSGECTIESKELVMDINGRCYIDFEVRFPEGQLRVNPITISINID